MSDHKGSCSDEFQLKAHILQLIKCFSFLYLLKLICMLSQAHGSLLLIKATSNEDLSYFKSFADCRKVSGYAELQKQKKKLYRLVRS